MIILGQICLLAAFVAVGYAAFACVLGSRAADSRESDSRESDSRGEHRSLLWTGLASAVFGVVALTVVMAVLAWALLTKNFDFNYVAQYSSRRLPWHYSLSALWVGQSGSLLLWTWMLGVLSLAFRFWPGKQPTALRDPAFGILMAYCGFLTATMVFAADPMEANIAPGEEGVGLSPLLQHPAMLIHPPIVFLGYASWAIPCALAIAALLSGRVHVDRCRNEMAGEHSQPNRPANWNAADSWTSQSKLDSTWVRIARPWSLFAWTVLGVGILMGAYWSYEELGWGGYWAWDPVENGSLIPWLIGTAFLHTLMAWHYCGMLKKTSFALAIGTFGMCNFATFLTRSGIFSSLHAFSQSPIGWLFLGLMLLLVISGAWLIARNRQSLGSDRLLTSVWTREAFVILSMWALLSLAAVTVAGTLSVALSEAIVGRRIMVGPEFYNHVLMPIGLLLLATMAAAPLLRWGSTPIRRDKQAFVASAILAMLPTAMAWLCGVRHPLALGVTWLAACCVVTHVAPAVLESYQRDQARPLRGLLGAVLANRRLYASFLIHLGIVCIVIGVTGSSLGSQRHELVMQPGEVVSWAGRSIRFQRLIERDLSDKFVVEAELEVSSDDGQPVRLLPAQHLHRLQDQWTTEVAIHSTWGGDFYTILHNGEAGEAVRLTLVDNPLMRCMWLGGWVIVAGTTVRLWPGRRVRKDREPPKPHYRTKPVNESRRELATAGV